MPDPQPWDLTRILFGDAPPSFLLEVVLRAVLIYVALVAAFRLLGKRMAGQVTVLEIGVMICLGAIIAMPMQSPKSGVLLGALLLVGILTYQRTLARLALASYRVEILAQGEAVCIVADGVVDEHALLGARVSKEQLYAALRVAGVDELGAVRRAYLEACGAISVLRRPPRPGPGLRPRDQRTAREQASS